MAEYPSELKGLRILAFADWYTPSASGGAERAGWEVYRRLGAVGAEVHVISAAHGVPHDDPGVDVTVIPALDFSRFVGGYLAPAPSAFPAGARLIKRLRPHVLHANTLHYTGCVAAAWLATRKALPLVATAHLGPPDQLPWMARIASRLYEGIVSRYVLAHAGQVLAVSRAARDHAVHLGGRPECISVVPNGVDHDRYALPLAGRDQSPVVMASVGRLLRNKGPQLLVAAAARLAADGLDFTLRFIGDGPLRSTLEAEVRAAGIAERVTFTGHVKNPADALGDVEIVVRPSYTEGLSLTVLEAMSAGRAVVVSDIRANAELISDHENGLLFRVGDVEDLARTLRVLVTNADLRGALGARARSDSRAFSWDRMATEHALAFVRAAKRTSGGETDGPLAAAANHAELGQATRS